MNEDESIRFAAKFLEDILSFFGINVAVTSTLDDEVIRLNVPSTTMNGILIGKADTHRRALQHIVTMALVAKGAERTRVMIDIAGRRRERELQLTEWMDDLVSQLRRNDKPIRLNLNAADRRIIHKLAQDYSDIETHSEGEGKERVLIMEKVV